MLVKQLFHKLLYMRRKGKESSDLLSKPGKRFDLYQAQYVDCEQISALLLYSSFYHSFPRYHRHM